MKLSEREISIQRALLKSLSQSISKQKQKSRKETERSWTQEIKIQLQRKVPQKPNSKQKSWQVPHTQTTQSFSKIPNWLQKTRQPVNLTIKFQELSQWARTWQLLPAYEAFQFFQKFQAIQKNKPKSIQLKE